MRIEHERMQEAPIRVVEFTKSFWFGGTEVQVVELLRGLPGHFQLQVAVLEETGPLMEEVWQLGHMPKAFPLKGSVAKANTAWQVLRMADWLRTHRVEVVHVHDFYPTIIAVPAAKLAGAKVVVGRLDLAHWHGKARRALLTAMTRMADHVIGNAEAIRTMLIKEEGIDPLKISVIRNGLDIAKFDARVRAGLKSPLPETNGAPSVVHVANMNHPVKRQEDLIEAIRMLKGEGILLHAYLVGDGPRRSQLEKVAAEKGVAELVHFLGYRADVPAIYQRATMGVLCSSAEGLSNAVMEGMAGGLPMVVTNVGGNPEIVTHEERGLVTEPFKPEQLAAAFKTLLANPDKAKAMGAAARKYVEAELSLRRLCERHDELYQRLARPGLRYSLVQSPA